MNITDIFGQNSFLFLYYSYFCKKNGWIFLVVTYLFRTVSLNVLFLEAQLLSNYIDFTDLLPHSFSHGTFIKSLASL